MNNPFLAFRHRSEPKVPIPVSSCAFYYDMHCMHIVSHFLYGSLFPRKQTKSLIPTTASAKAATAVIDLGWIESQHDHTIGTQIVSSQAWVMLLFCAEPRPNWMHDEGGFIYSFGSFRNSRVLEQVHDRCDCLDSPPPSIRSGLCTMGHYYFGYPSVILVCSW